MDKNLVITRNTNRDLKSSTKKSGNNYIVSEKHPAYAASAKKYYTSHDHFHNTPHRNSTSRKHRAFLPEAVSLYNEDYIHANSQIWLNQECLKSNYDFNDIYHYWDSIIQINFYTSEEVMCPICLNTPTVCRTDKCGHIYCFPCMNTFLSYGNGFYKNCALCNQEIDPKRVKRASFIHRFPLKAGDHISMLLMKRDKSELFPVPINLYQSNVPYSYSNESRFSNIVICPNEDLLSIIQLEILTLEDQLAEAIREESDTVKSILEALQSLKNEYSLTLLSPTIAKPLKADPVPVEIDNLKEIMQNNNVYYQAEDGTNVFMCPLNWKCVMREFVDNNQCLPLRISGQILEIEKYTATPDFLNRYRYLRNLPIGSSVCFVELDLSTIVSQSTMDKFGREIQRKNDNRVNKEKIDQLLTREKIKHENSFNSSVGFVCLNSLMKETNNLLDPDFIPLPTASSNSPVEISSKSPDEKPLSFADMMHASHSQPVAATPFVAGQMKPIEENQNRGFSLQDCLVKKTKKKPRK